MIRKWSFAVCCELSFAAAGVSPYCVFARTVHQFCQNNTSFFPTGGAAAPQPPRPVRWCWKLHSSFPVHFDRFLSFEKKKQCQRTKKAPPLPPPPPSQLIFSLRLIKGKLSPRWVLIWAFRVFSLGVFSCDWWKAQTKAKCNSCALDSEHLSNPTIPSDRAIVRERKNKSGKKILFHAMEGTSSGGYYREFCSKWNWCKKYFNQ